MNKPKTYLLTILAVFVVFILAWFSFFRNINKNDNSSTPKQSQSILKGKGVEVTIDFGAGRVMTFPVKYSDGDSAYSVVERATKDNKLAFQIQEYDFGKLVLAIDGYSNSSEAAWIYFVNGESGQVAADHHDIKQGDVVEWKYLAPEGE
jgi:hypothetical protein